jgi:hypothetical protein
MRVSTILLPLVAASVASAQLDSIISVVTSGAASVFSVATSAVESVATGVASTVTSGAGSVVSDVRITYSYHQTLSNMN